MTQKPRLPQAFVIEDEDLTKKSRPEIRFAAEEPQQQIVHIPHVPTAKRGLRWGTILTSALASLFSLWAGFTITQMIANFFVSSPFLGWIAVVTAAIACLAGTALILKEIIGFSRLRRIEKMQITAAHALNQDDDASARQTVIDLIALYREKPDAGWNLQNFKNHADDILDPRDRVRLIERYLVDPLDETAHRIIARRARRVTLLTTVTPAAALDILFVAAQNIMMMREIATLYGGRPSTFSTIKLARMVVTHLAIAGGLALSDNFLHLFIGKGILGKLSARFGEGAVNGILTSRIGLAACEVCRPIPQDVTKREKLSSLLKEITSFTPSQKPD